MTRSFSRAFLSGIALGLFVTVPVTTASAARPITSLSFDDAIQRGAVETSLRSTCAGKRAITTYISGVEYYVDCPATAATVSDSPVNYAAPGLALAYTYQDRPKTRYVTVKVRCLDRTSFNQWLEDTYRIRSTQGLRSFFARQEIGVLLRIRRETLSFTSPGQQERAYAPVSDLVRMTTAENSATSEQISALKTKIESSGGDAERPALGLLCPDQDYPLSSFGLTPQNHASLFFESFLIKDNEPGRIFNLLGAIIDGAVTFSGVETAIFQARVTDTKKRLEGWNTALSGIADEFDIAKSKAGQPIALMQGTDRRLATMTLSYKGTEALELTFDWRESLLTAPERKLGNWLAFRDMLAGKGFNVADLSNGVTLTAAQLLADDKATVDEACGKFRTTMETNLGSYDPLTAAAIARFELGRRAQDGATEDRIAYCLGPAYGEILLQSGDWSTAFLDARKRLFPPQETQTIKDIYTEHQRYPSVVLGVLAAEHGILENTWKAKAAAFTSGLATRDVGRQCRELERDIASELNRLDLFDEENTAIVLLAFAREKSAQSPKPALSTTACLGKGMSGAIPRDLWPHPYSEVEEHIAAEDRLSRPLDNFALIDGFLLNLARELSQSAQRYALTGSYRSLDRLVYERFFDSASFVDVALTGASLDQATNSADHNSLRLAAKWMSEAPGPSEEAGLGCFTRIDRSQTSHARGEVYLRLRRPGASDTGDVATFDYVALKATLDVKPGTRDLRISELVSIRQDTAFCGFMAEKRRGRPDCQCPSTLASPAS